MQYSVRKSTLALLLITQSHLAVASQAPLISSHTAVNSSISDRSVDPYGKKVGLTLGLQAPTPLFAEIHIRPLKKLTFAFGTGFLPASIYLSNILRLQDQAFLSNVNSVEGKVRWHTGGGSFYLGLGGGWQTAGVRASEQGTNRNIGTISANRVYISPHLGWLWIKQSGFTIGTELGAQIPISSALTIQADPDYANHKNAQNVTQRIKNQVEPYLNYVTPYVTFVQMGYMF